MVSFSDNKPASQTPGTREYIARNYRLWQWLCDNPPDVSSDVFEYVAFRRMIFDRWSGRNAS